MAEHSPKDPSPLASPAPDAMLEPDAFSAWLRQEEDYAVLAIDPQGLIVASSPATSRVLGYEPDELIGRDANIFFTSEDVARGLSAHELAVAHAVGRAEDDRWHVRKDGTRIWMGGTVTPLRDRQGALMGYVKLMRDRTDLRAQLEALANRITALHAALERKEAFLKTLVHELANPLGPLRQSLQQLEQLERDEPSKRLQRVAVRQTEALIRLLANVRTAMLQEDRPNALQIEPVHLQEFLSRLVEASQFSAQAHGVHLELLTPQVPIWLQVDPGRFEQIVTNLIGNAVKYTPAGGHVWVTSTIEDKFVVVRVRDDGVGVAADMLPRIFDLFTQEVASRHLSGGGMGVGLAVVKELVRLHDGTVEVRSDGRGKGSEFTVRLPLDGPRPDRDC